MSPATAAPCGDAKLVPVSEGSFDLDDYVDYLIEFTETIGAASGERPHMLAVCQPAVPAFAATTLMNADKNEWRPKTLTMMGVGGFIVSMSLCGIALFCGKAEA